MKSKVGIIGTGMVGMSYAYSMVNQGTCEAQKIPNNTSII